MFVTLRNITFWETASKKIRTDSNNLLWGNNKVNNMDSKII